MKAFPISPDTMVVTSKFVTMDWHPIRLVSREADEEGGELWQFHSGNENYSMDEIQLVRLDTVIKLDPTIQEIGDLPMGFCARRPGTGAPWVYQKEESAE